jgi:hypothetical protein
VYLVVKLRLAPPTAHAVVEAPEETGFEAVKLALKRNEEKDYQFLTGQNDAEEVPDSAHTSGWAHAPYWPAVRCLFFRTTRISCILVAFLIEPQARLVACSRRR